MLNKINELDVKNIENYITLNYDLVEEIYKNYQKKFYKISYKRTRNIERAKDITQNTLEVILKSVGKNKKISNLDAWLYTILKYKCYDTSKNKNLINYYSNDILENYMFENVVDLMEKIDLYDALKELNEVNRKIIIYKYVYGFSNKEIANFCKCSDSTVRRKIYKSLEIMREKLKKC